MKAYAASEGFAHSLCVKVNCSTDDYPDSSYLRHIIDLSNAHLPAGTMAINTVTKLRKKKKKRPLKIMSHLVNMNGFQRLLKGVAIKDQF